ncbi:MAG: hypothetical protein Sylvanvirus26_10 [Sylvanvirus sp.]|uniref:Magnesium transporter n=1 Tax=Sylvanvirus sp. TaxID=2487774 RepID=A0A3G5AIX1_9VIRU|nr:MAG: hypothetical protein Sylvanvirus26_10 [Sylvanvirus sp.]
MIPTWIIGVGLALVGSIGSNFGQNLQRLSFRRNDILPQTKQRATLRQPYFLSGLLLIILGSVCDFSAFSLAAQSIIAPIGAITLVSNVIFARFLNQEQIHSYDIASCFMIVIGSVVSVVYGDHSNRTLNVNQSLSYFIGTPFIIYFICILLLTLIFTYIHNKLNPILKNIIKAEKTWKTAKMIRDDETMKQQMDFLSELDKQYPGF